MFSETGISSLRRTVAHSPIFLAWYAGKRHRPTGDRLIEDFNVGQGKVLRRNCSRRMGFAVEPGLRPESDF